MMILWKEKLAFLAMPKTGTTAIEAALRPHADIDFHNPPNVKHMSARKFNRFIRRYLENMGLEGIETMAVMREPIDWLGSWYRYRRRDALKGQPKGTHGVTFDAFVEAYLTPGNRPPFAEIGTQSTFLTGGSDDIIVDHLFRYEDIENVQKFLCERTGKNLSFPKLNVSPTIALSLSPDLEARLRQTHAADFAIYENIT